MLFLSTGREHSVYSLMILANAVAAWFNSHITTRSSQRGRVLTLDGLDVHASQTVRVAHCWRQCETALMLLVLYGGAAVRVLNSYEYLYEYECVC